MILTESLTDVTLASEDGEYQLIHLFHLIIKHYLVKKVDLVINVIFLIKTVT